MSKELKERFIIFFKEGGLEFLRLAELSVIPVLLTGINLTTGEIAINWLIVKALLLIAVIKGVDKGLHKSCFAEKGIVRF